MRIDIMTLFPAVVDAVMHESIIGRAAEKGIVQINCVQIRDLPRISRIRWMTTLTAEDGAAS